MVEVTLKLEKEDEMSKFIYFLYKSEVKIDVSSEFYSLLYSAIGNDTIHPEWMSSLKMMEHFETMEKFYPNDSLLKRFILRVKGCSEESFNTVRLKPTEEFRRQCGSVWLDKNGCMTKRNAYDYVMLHAKVRNLMKDDEYIYLDAYLSALLKDDRQRVDKHDLIECIDRLF
jgi:hypothetical protein